MADWLVTGGAGFIGSHLVDALLRRGHTVRVLDDLSSGHRGNLSPRAELAIGDVTDPRAVARAAAGVRGVFHLAAIASVAQATERWAQTHAVNQTGTVTVLEAARRIGGLPVVYASSAAVYGETGGEAIPENQPTRPCSAYGCDKLGSELHAAVASRSFGVPTTGLRFFNVYGPRQDGASPYSGVISAFRHAINAGRTLVLNGDGRQTRDFVFVADVVTALLAAMDRLRAAPSDPVPRVFNVCTGRATSIVELARMLCEMEGQAASFRHGPPRVGDILHSRGDPRLLADTIGVECSTTIRAGLERLAVAERQAPPRPGSGAGGDVAAAGCMTRMTR